ncbi:MAG: AAA family ATPase [Myxococcota bacterium]|nr:AAA family ATPase [Myxococcota bacterium]
MRAFLQQLRLQFQARYPVVQLLSHEEERVERALEGLAGQEQMSLYTWRSTRGMHGPEGPVGEGEPPEEGRDRALEALRALEGIQAPSLFVLHDFHPYLDEPLVIRKLRDLAGELGSRRQAIVLVGPQFHVPLELEKDISVLDVPLPERQEVSHLLRVLLQSQGLQVAPDLFEQFVQGSLGLTEAEIKRLYARILLGGEGFGQGDLGTLVEEKRKAIRRSRFLEFWDESSKIQQVGGMDALKAWLDQRALGFTEKARAFGLPEPRGLFLLGVQGCGKSLVAKSVADLWSLPLLRLDVAAVFESTGRQEESLRQTIRIAESLAPVILWIDELEKGFSSDETGGGQAFGNFLTWMQEKSSTVFVVATANEVRRLPPELLRKGRFDEIFFVDLPNVHERLEILEIHLNKRARDPELFDLLQAAEETEKFSGAELEQVVVAGLYRAFSESRELTGDDLLDVIRELIPLAITMDDRLKSLREWARPRARPASTSRRRLDFFEEWDEVQ